MAFITFEGIDGSGKSTVARMVAEETGYILTAEPTDGPLGMELREASERGDGCIVEALLFTADRYVHTEQIKKWLNDGKGVISDRYLHSTVAYQLAEIEQKEEKEGKHWIGGDRRQMWKEWLIGIGTPASIKPDLTLLIDVDVETGLARARERGRLSSFEKVELLKLVRRNYLELAEDGRWNIAVIDGTQGIDDVVKAVMKEIKQIGKN